MDFMNLADVPEVESVQDGDTVFAVRDGEVCRVAKDKVSGTGNYVVNVAAGEIVADDAFVVLTPVPGMLEAVANGAVVTIVVDFGLLVEEGELGENISITVLDVCDMSVLEEEYAGWRYANIIIFGECFEVYFSDGQAYSTEASVATMSLDGGTETVATRLASLREKLRSKLGGGTSDEL